MVDGRRCARYARRGARPSLPARPARRRAGRLRPVAGPSMIAGPCVRGRPCAPETPAAAVWGRPCCAPAWPTHVALERAEMRSAVAVEDDASLAFADRRGFSEVSAQVELDPRADGHGDRTARYRQGSRWCRSMSAPSCSTRPGGVRRGLRGHADLPEPVSHPRAVARARSRRPRVSVAHARRGRRWAALSRSAGALASARPGPPPRTVSPPSAASWRRPGSAPVKQVQRGARGGATACGVSSPRRRTR